MEAGCWVLSLYVMGAVMAEGTGPLASSLQTFSGPPAASAASDRADRADRADIRDLLPAKPAPPRTVPDPDRSPSSPSLPDPQPSGSDGSTADEGTPPPPSQAPPPSSEAPAEAPATQSAKREAKSPDALRAVGRLSPLEIDALEAQGVVIGSIRIRTIEIFDTTIPAENRRLYRTVNRLHVLSREGTVRHQLTFAEGEPLVRSRLEETERNLRQLAFLQDAAVDVEGVEDGRAIVVVTAQDAWTTRVGARFGSAGGKSTNSVRLSEINLMGWGKRVDLNFVNGIDRSTRSLVYSDPNLLGSRHRVQVGHEESSDGKGTRVIAERPFFSQDTRLAYGINASRRTDRFSLYSAGEVVQKFDHEATNGEIWVGWSRGLRNNLVPRWAAGYSFDDNVYDPTDRLHAGFAPENVPITRKTSGLFGSYTLIRQDFIKVRYFERFSRYEDYNLGGQLSVKLTVSREAFGGTDDELIYTFQGSKGFRTGPDTYVFGNAEVKGRAGGREQGSGHVDLTQYYTAWPRQTFVMELSADRSVRQNASDRYLLGGESGLRGYKLRRFDGTNRFLITLEDRLHYEREYLRLLRLGLAFFLDVGNAWGGTRTEEQKICMTNPQTQMKTCSTNDVSFDNKFGNLKANVGIAILGDIVRASGAGFVRLNIAYPINGEKYDQGTILLSFGR